MDADIFRLKVAVYDFTAKGVKFAKTLLPQLCVLGVLCGIVFHKLYILTATPTGSTNQHPRPQSAAPGIGGRSSGGRAAQVSGEWRAAGE